MLVAAFILRATRKRNLYVLGNAIKGGRLEGDLAERFVALPCASGSFVGVIDDDERIRKKFRWIDVRIFDRRIFALESFRVACSEHDRRDGLCRGIDDSACGNRLALFAAFDRLYR